MVENELYSRFNKRDSSAFNEVYLLVYREIYAYAHKLFCATEIDPSDVIHDIFIAIWDLKELKFSDSKGIKAYLYASIKNRFKNYIAHQKHVDNYSKDVMLNEFHLNFKAIESEFQVLLLEKIESLPSDYAHVIKLYLEGWNKKEIAEKLQITEKSVYNRRNKAVEMIKKSIKLDCLYIFCNLLT